MSAVDAGENGEGNVFHHEHGKIKKFKKLVAHLPIMKAALSATPDTFGGSLLELA